jgi:ADP-Ribosyltransferase in polyvalent proteins/ParB-like nuclease domain
MTSCFLPNTHLTGADGTGPFVSDAPLRSVDPTNTLKLRKALHASLTMRLRQLKAQMRAAVIGYDILGLGHNLAMKVNAQDAKLAAWSQWLDTTMAQAMSGEWLEAKLSRAWVMGREMAQGEVGGPVYAPLPVDVELAARIELGSLESALRVQAARAAASAIKTRLTTARAWANISAAFDTATANRAIAFASTIVVATHIHAKVAVYRQAGIRKVGIAAERLAPDRQTLSGRLRQLDRGITAPVHDATTEEIARRREHYGADPVDPGEDPSWEALRAEGDEDESLVNVLTAGDDDVCQICEDIADDSPYDIDEVLDLLPAHVNCRCSVTPFDDRRFKNDQQFSRDNDDQQARTLYVRRPLKNADDLIAWAHRVGFSKTLAPDDMHVTIAFSKTPVDWSSIEAEDTPISDRSKVRSVEMLGDKGAVVLRFNSPELQKRWNELGAAGAVWDYPTYNPHVTITYDGGDVDLSVVAPFLGPLEFGPEIFERVKDDWHSNIKLVGDMQSALGFSLPSVKRKRKRKFEVVRVAYPQDACDAHYVVDVFDPNESRDPNGKWVGGMLGHWQSSSGGDTHHDAKDVLKDAVKEVGLDPNFDCVSIAHAVYVTASHGKYDYYQVTQKSKKTGNEEFKHIFMGDRGTKEFFDGNGVQSNNDMKNKWLENKGDKIEKIDPATFSEFEENRKMLDTLTHTKERYKKLIQKLSGITGDAFDPNEPRDPQGRWGGGSDGKFYGVVTEITHLPASTIKPMNQQEWNGAISSQRMSGLSSVDWADTIDLSEPVNVSLFSDGTLKLSDGHHRVLAAQILDKNVSVILKSINGKSNDIIKLIAMQNLSKDASDAFDPNEERDPHGRWSESGDHPEKLIRVDTGDKVDGLIVRKDIPNTSSISSSVENYKSVGVREVPFSAFIGGPAKPTNRIKGLAGQIESSGEINPLIVVYEDFNKKEGPYILEGSHRFDALGYLGKKSFPALVLIDYGDKKVGDAFNPDQPRDPQGRWGVVGGSVAQIDMPQFKAWFGNSKVVDAGGKPLVLYHGTDSPLQEFSREKIKDRFPLSFGFHFTSRTQEANIYAEGLDPEFSGVTEGANVLPVYLKAENPLVVETKNMTASMESDLNHAELIHEIVASRKTDRPYDSIIIKRARGDEYDGMNIIVFNPEQIKSAIGNRGTFDPKSSRLVDGDVTDVFMVGKRTSNANERDGWFDLAVLQDAFDPNEPRNEKGEWDGGGAYNRSLAIRLSEAKKNRDNERGSALDSYNAESQKEWLTVSPPRDGKLTLYRAVPIGYSGKIRPGDYVTNIRSYAQQHIDSNLGKEGKILSIGSDLGEIHPADGPKEFWYYPHDDRKYIADIFDPNEPRNEKGEWSPGSGGGVDTVEFKSWFGNSKAVGSDGSPLVVYHGTGASFEKFNLGVGGPGQYRDTKGAIFFVSEPRVASSFAEIRGRGKGASANVIPAFLSIKNPLVYDFKGDLKSSTQVVDLIKKAKKAGNDGVHIKNVVEPIGHDFDRPIGDLWVAFKPTQIKSAIGNKGTFDPTKQSIIDTFNPDQPRDYHGRWGAGSNPDIGGPPLMEKEELLRGATPERYAEEARRMQLFARDKAKAMDYDPEKVFVTPNDHTFVLNGNQYNAAGTAAKDGTGIITLYSKQLSISDIEPILAHEIMHQKFNMFLDDFNKGVVVFHTTNDELNRFAKEDGVTGYSANWWSDWRKRHKDPSTELSMDAKPITETLAEMATLHSRGEVPRSMVTGKPSELWTRFYDAVNEHWANRERK